MEETKEPKTLKECQAKLKEQWKRQKDLEDVLDVGKDEQVYIDNFYEWTFEAYKAIEGVYNHDPYALARLNELVDMIDEAQEVLARKCEGKTLLGKE